MCAVRGVITAAEQRQFLGCMCKALLTSAVQQHDQGAVRSCTICLQVMRASAGTTRLRCTGIACRISFNRNDMHMLALELRTCVLVFCGSLVQREVL